MSMIFRESLPAGEPHGTVLCLHGFPETSHMWTSLLGYISEAGWRGVAPDFPGYGDTPYAGDGSWEAQVAALDSFWEEQERGPVVLVVHDWGGIIGLRWAVQRPEAIRALVISDTGFFSDGQWHDFAQVMRTPEEGEKFIEQWNREMLAQILGTISTGIDDRAIDEYAKALATPEGRRGILELYRSGDFDKIEDGSLSVLEMPALILWGESDPFAPVGGAHRFVKELPDAELVVVDGAGHIWMGAEYIPGGPRTDLANWGTFISRVTP